MRNAHQKPGRSAFSLIELVTVMVILGIMAVFVGGPTLAYIDDVRVHAASLRLTSDVRYMQRMALGSGYRTWLVFDLTNNRYSLYVEDAANPGKAGRVLVINPLDLTTGPVQFGSGPFGNVSLSTVDFNTTAELEFDSFGAPYDANGVELTSVGQVVLSSSVAIRVHPVGGLVEHKPWP